MFASYFRGLYYTIITWREALTTQAVCLTLVIYFCMAKPLFPPKSKQIRKIPLSTSSNFKAGTVLVPTRASNQILNYRTDQAITLDHLAQLRQLRRERATAGTGLSKALKEQSEGKLFPVHSPGGRWESPASPGCSSCAAPAGERRRAQAAQESCRALPSCALGSLLPTNTQHSQHLSPHSPGPALLQTFKDVFP